MTLQPLLRQVLDSDIARCGFIRTLDKSLLLFYLYPLRRICMTSELEKASHKS